MSAASRKRSVQGVQPFRAAPPDRRLLPTRLPPPHQVPPFRPAPPDRCSACHLCRGCGRRRACVPAGPSPDRCHGLFAAVRAMAGDGSGPEARPAALRRTRAGPCTAPGVPRIPRSGAPPPERAAARPTGQRVTRPSAGAPGGRIGVRRRMLGSQRRVAVPGLPARQGTKGTKESQILRMP